MEFAKITAKGQLTLPKKVRETLKVGIGDNVVFITKGKGFVVLNANDVERIQKAVFEEDAV